MKNNEEKNTLKVIKEFKVPSSEYRGVPFWAWNSKLEPEELKRQIRIMNQMGLGGFFMHSRIGLVTPYLSKEWFDCVKACIEESEITKMKAWLYDEDRWPSGAAGGLVTKNTEYRHRYLKLESIEINTNLKKLHGIAFYLANVEGNVLKKFIKIDKNQKNPDLKEFNKILVFRIKIDDCSDWFNGYTYLDTLNPKAVRKFIEITHESYKKHCGKAFGKIIPGIFTDEPNYGYVNVENGLIPWTETLPKVFKKRYGYSIFEKLPLLFFEYNGDGPEKIRHDYIDCITFMFVEAFAKQIGEWCKKNKMLHTGHVLCEETLFSQTKHVGSAMRFYEHMQAPGIDILTQFNREYDTAKQVSSVARQFGRKWRLSETYGCTGWDFPFAGHKAVGDWQVALGINLRCQHLSWYSMAGQAKRDYPASIHYQSPWWKFYRKVEDYFARVHTLMSEGEEIRDVLIIHPIESIWIKVRPGWEKDPVLQEIQTNFIRLRDILLSGHIDFDYGDEDIIARHGKVIKNNGSAIFRITKADYKAIIVPQLLTIRTSTLKLLEKFIDTGGIVIWIGNPPPFIDGMKSKMPLKIFEKCLKLSCPDKEILKMLEKFRRVSITDKDNIEITSVLYLLREDTDAYYLFLCNTGYRIDELTSSISDPTPVSERNLSFDSVYVKVSVDSNKPLEFDPVSGKIFDTVSFIENNVWSIKTSLGKIGSRLFVFPKKEITIKNIERHPYLTTVKSEKLTLPEKLNIHLDEDNVVVLDMPEWCIGKEGWKNPLEILKVDNVIRSSLGLKPRSGSMKQPWADSYELEKKVEVSLKYKFEVKNIPSGPVWLGIEFPELYHININGIHINTYIESGWWCDKSLKKIFLTHDLLKNGINIIELQTVYSALHPGLETIYLLGNFGVKIMENNMVSIEKPVTELSIGDWVKQGLPFYSGNVSYEIPVIYNPSDDERIFIKFTKFNGTALRIIYNSQEIAMFGWEPYECDITDILKENNGKIILLVQILGHRRNSHGPLHLNDPVPRWTGPSEFVTEKDKWNNSYQLVPCGLMESPCLEIKR